MADQTGRRGDHLCWAYTDPADLHQRAVAFLTEGLSRGHRIEYLAAGAFADLLDHVAGLTDRDTLLLEGRLGIRSLDDLYGVDEVVDPAVPLAAYAAATDAAVEDGYTGLTVVADATPLVRSDEQRRAFRRYEHLVDRYMTDHPFAAMCAYDVTALGWAAAAELACLHPDASDGSTGFRWYAGVGGSVHLDGEVDIANMELFDDTVALTLPTAARSVTVDGSRLEFLDHRAMLSLERQARRHDIKVTLVSDAPVVHRLADLLGLRAVRPQWQ
ncbi:MAG TPA: MEDS domain-containing protein [Egibacteraceae bacterium]|nr:MEDS domain-containing protein [Egibacteraceae bacterium]